MLAGRARPARALYSGRRGRAAHQPDHPAQVRAGHAARPPGSAVRDPGRPDDRTRPGRVPGQPARRRRTGLPGSSRRTGRSRPPRVMRPCSGASNRRNTLPSAARPGNQCRRTTGRPSWSPGSSRAGRADGSRRTFGRLGSLLGRLHTRPSDHVRDGGGWHHLVHQGTPAAEIAAARSRLDAAAPGLPADQGPLLASLAGRTGPRGRLRGPAAGGDPPGLRAGQRRRGAGRRPDHGGLDRRRVRPAAVPAGVPALGGGLPGTGPAGRGGGRLPRDITLTGAEIGRLAGAIWARPLVLACWTVLAGRKGLAETVADLAAGRELAERFADQAARAFQGGHPPGNPRGPATRGRSRWTESAVPDWRSPPCGRRRPPARTACSPTRWPRRSRRPGGGTPTRLPGAAGRPRCGPGWWAAPCSWTTCWLRPASRAAARSCCSGPGSTRGRSGCAGRQAPGASRWTRPTCSAPRTRCSAQAHAAPGLRADRGALRPAGQLARRAAHRGAGPGPADRMDRRGPAGLPDPGGRGRAPGRDHRALGPRQLAGADHDDPRPGRARGRPAGGVVAIPGASRSAQVAGQAGLGRGSRGPARGAPRARPRAT